MLKQLLNDLTRPEITACAELNLLPSLCYSQDLALLGPGLQDVDQHYIEEQVRPQSTHQGNSLVNAQSVPLIDSLVTVHFIFNLMMFSVCLKFLSGGSGGGTLEYDPFTIFEKAQEVPTPPSSSLCFNGSSCPAVWSDFSPPGRSAEVRSRSPQRIPPEGGFCICCCLVGELLVQFILKGSRCRQTRQVIQLHYIGPFCKQYPS